MYDKSVDIWCLGILIYELCCGRSPFDSHSQYETKSKIKQGQYQFPEHLSAECKDLIRRILQNVPAIRISLREIFEHPWIKKRDLTLM